MTSKVSVIVPVYNVEKYLDRCINSILNQSYYNIEVILIDDGSTDSSGDICEKWKKRDDRIKVIHKENAGLGYARNSGMEIMKGEYCIFVDSDDFIEINMIEIMMKAIEKSNASMCYSSFDFYSNDLNKATKHGFVKTGVYNGKDVLLDIIGTCPKERMDYNKEMSVWAALFSTSIIFDYKLEFPSEREIICEDLPFDIQYLPKVDRVVIIENEFYHYCYNDSSLTHKYDKKRYEKEIYLYQFVQKKLSEIYEEKEFEIRLKRLFLGRIRASMNIEIKNSKQPIAIILKDLKEVSENAIVQDVLSNYPYHLNPIKIRIFNYFIHKKIAFILYMLCILR